jgi:hypothetical protein
MEEDKMLESFFDGMKQADAQRPVPTFEKPTPVRRLKSPLLRYGIAAAVTLVLATVLYQVRQAGDEQPPQAKDIVIVVEPAVPQTGSLVNTTEQTLSEWKSPTSYLSEDL